MKKNIIIVVLCIIIVCLLTYIVYDKINSSDSDSSINNNGIQQNSNTVNSNNYDNSKQESVSVEETFNGFVKKQNLTTSNNVFDSDSLKQMNCENAISANGNGYSLGVHAKIKVTNL